MMFIENNLSSATFTFCNTMGATSAQSAGARQWEHGQDVPPKVTDRCELPLPLHK